MSDLFVTDSRRTYSKELISTLDGYLNHVERLVDLWGAPSVWFRGLPSVEYALTPGIYRPKFSEIGYYDAADLANEFIRRGKAFLPDMPDKKWHWHHVMQHYGLPTRLLDWTDGALIGLFFALRNRSSPYRPCVWVLNPYWLNLISAGEECVYFTDEVSQDDEDREIANKYQYDLKELPRYPIAVVPPHVDERINAQRSKFTVHGSLKTGLFRLWKDSDGKQLAQLRISRRSAQKMMKQLELSGLTESTLFPDLEGLSRELIGDLIESY